MDVTLLPDVEPRPRRVAVGEFDGVHLGHRRVIDANDTVLTFEPHPATVVHPERAPKLLTSLARKAELIAKLGVKELVVIPFDASFANQSPEAFVEQVLVRGLGATHVSVGDNFRFGHNATGTTELLAADGRFSTHVSGLVEADGQTISSSRIRTLVGAGDLTEANRLLVDPFRLRGTVVPGDRRGRELGFPTANIVPDPALVCPGFGIYACRARWDGKTRLAATSVGVRPTFGEGLLPLVEPYLLDFSGDLYGVDLELEFLSRIRGELRFDGVDALVEQMHDDVAEVRRRLG